MSADGGATSRQWVHVIHGPALMQGSVVLFSQCNMLSINPERAHSGLRAAMSSNERHAHL